MTRSSNVARGPITVGEILEAAMITWMLFVLSRTQKFITNVAANPDPVLFKPDIPNTLCTYSLTGSVLTPNVHCCSNVTFHAPPLTRRPTRPPHHTHPPLKKPHKTANPTLQPTPEPTTKRPHHTKNPTPRRQPTHHPTRMCALGVNNESPQQHVQHMTKCKQLCDSGAIDAELSAAQASLNGGERRRALRHKLQ